MTGHADAFSTQSPQPVWRVIGAILLGLSVLPVYASLRRPDTGLAGAATADMAADAAGMVWTGTLFAVAVGIVTARLLDPARTTAALDAMSRRVLRVNGVLFASAVALAGMVLSLIVEIAIFHREPVLLDAIVQLTHARYLAAGHGAAPADTIGFFRMQQTAPVAGGWISQYPPMHVVLLAAGAALNAAWLTGPIMLGVTLFFTARAIDILVPGRASARIGVLLAAASPFLLAHAATYMSHTTAAAFIALALYAFAQYDRAPSDRPFALIACGVAVGATFATRPLTGLTVGLVLAAALNEKKRSARSLLFLATGALPIACAVAFYNAHYFGGFTRFGYDVALGPDAGLGFGTDPWGNRYGVLQALSYTSAELVSLSLQLLETPLPLVAAVALFLIRTTRLERGLAVVTSLALAPLASHLFYWHHGLFMGPRMLNEYGVLWCVIAVVAAASLVYDAPVHTRLFGRYSPQNFLVGVFAAGFAGALLLAPQRLRSYAAPRSQSFDAASAAAGRLVFVHGGWGERVAMQLAARGWRLDEVETAMRQNSTCSVQRVLDGAAPRSALDLVPRATALPRRVEVPRGNPVRVVDGEEWTASCAAQIASDGAGTIDPSTLFWRGALPGVKPGARSAPLFARDLGPALNQTLASSNDDARVLMRGPAGEPKLVSYEEGMRQLWKVAPQ